MSQVFSASRTEIFHISELDELRGHTKNRLKCAILQTCKRYRTQFLKCPATEYYSNG